MASNKTGQKKTFDEGEESGTPHVDTTASGQVAHALGLHTPFPQELAPAQRGKVGLLAILCILSGLLMWFFYFNLLKVDFSESTRFDLWFWPIGSFVSFFFLVAFVAITALLVHERLISRSIFVLTALTYLVWFRLGWYTFFSLGLVLLALWQYDWQIKEEESLRIKFSVTKSMRHGLSAVIALILLAVSLTFYGHSIQNQPIMGSSLDPITEVSGNIANQLLALQVPEYNPKETLDDFLFRIASQQTKKLLDQRGGGQVSGSFSNASSLVDELAQVDFSRVASLLPEEVRRQVENDPERLKAALTEQANASVKQEFTKVRNKLVTDLGIAATGVTPMGEVLKQLIGKQLTSFLGPYEYFIPPLLALTIFFSLSIFTFLYAAIIKLFAFIIFSIIRASRFVQIRTVDAKVEVATLGGS